MEKVLHFTACGLVYDAVGVLLLGFAFFFKTKEAIIQEAGTCWDSNQYVLRSIIASKMDGMSGTILLFIGFVYQVLGYICIFSNPAIITSYVLLLIFVVIYFAFLRSCLIKLWQKSIQEKIDKIAA